MLVRPGRSLRGEPRTPEDAIAAEAVKRSVADGTASVPLPTAHVFEAWKQHRADKRQPAGADHDGDLPQ